MGGAVVASSRDVQHCFRSVRLRPALSARSLSLLSAFLDRYLTFFLPPWPSPARRSSRRNTPPPPPPSPPPPRSLPAGPGSASAPPRCTPPSTKSRAWAVSRSDTRTPTEGRRRGPGRFPGERDATDPNPSPSPSRPRPRPRPGDGSVSVSLASPAATKRGAVPEGRTRGSADPRDARVHPARSVPRRVDDHEVRRRRRGRRWMGVSMGRRFGSVGGGVVIVRAVRRTRTPSEKS